MTYHSILVKNKTTTGHAWLGGGRNATGLPPKFSTRAGRPRRLPQLLEHEPGHQVNGVVSAGVASSGVVIGAAAIETRVAGVLRREADILLRPPGDVQNVSPALWTTVRTARDRRLSKQQWVCSSSDAEQSYGARNPIAEVIFSLALHRVQVMPRERCRSSHGACYQRRVLANVRAPNRHDIVLPLRDGVVKLEVSSPIGVAILQTGHRSRRALHMHAVGADFKIVILVRCLEREPPVGSNAADVERKSIARRIDAGIRLRPSYVFGAIQRACEINMVVPHGISAKAGDVLGEASVDDRPR